MGFREELLPWDSQPQEAVGPDPALGASRIWTSTTGEIVVGAQPTTDRSERAVTQGGIGTRFNGTSSERLQFAAPQSSGDMTLVGCFVSLSTGNQIITGLFNTVANVASYIAIESGTIRTWCTDGSNWTDANGPAAVAGQLYVVVSTFVAGGGRRMFINGSFAAESTAARNPAGLNVWTSGLYTANGASESPLNGVLLLSGVLPYAAPDALAASLSANPWQLFAPRRIWVPQTAAGGATVALSGASASFQAGSVAPTASSTVALLGASAAFAQGTESVNISRALTGASSSFAQGNEAVVVSRALTGSSSAFSAGTVSPGANVTQALTGASASFAQGVESIIITRALTGQLSSFAAGNVAPSQAGTAQLSGQAVSTQAGTLAPSITRALTGVASTFAAGTVTPTQAAIQSLSGQAVTLAAGTLAPSVSATVALSGAAVVSAAGTVSPTQANIQALSGVSATLAAGTLTPVSSATVALSGLSAAVSLGVVGLPQSATVALVGESLSAVQGNLFIIGAWTPVNDAASNTWAPVNDAASNGWTQITWG